MSSLVDWAAMSETELFDSAEILASWLSGTGETEGLPDDRGLRFLARWGYTGMLTHLN